MFGYPTTDFVHNISFEIPHSRFLGREPVRSLEARPKWQCAAFPISPQLCKAEVSGGLPQKFSSPMCFLEVITVLILHPLA